MIEILYKKDCCGCTACAGKCPKQCISLKEDEEGFLYPHVNRDACIDCGLCETVCPVINQSNGQPLLHVYAAKNRNEEIRLKSSSGGIFTLLAEETLKERGVVFGARFDENWEVKHDYTETVEGLAAFRGSKYLQSRMEDNYKKAETFLKQGRKVLFSGSPCQIAGLKKFLRKEYGNLLAVDFICHGVPSPKVWRMYLDETCKKIIEQGGKNSVSSVLTNGGRKSCVEAIGFRNKILGWKKYSFSLQLNSVLIGTGKNTVGLCEPHPENIFMRGFLSNLYLRPACHQCAAKSGKSGSDLTIADYWGIGRFMPDFDDDRGVGLVLVNSTKGEKLYNTLSACMESRETGIEDALCCNAGFKATIAIPSQRSKFFIAMQNGMSMEQNVKMCLHIPFAIRVARKIKQRTKKAVKKIICKKIN